MPNELKEKEIALFGVETYEVCALSDERIDIDKALELLNIRRHPHMLYTAFKLAHYDETNTNGHFVESIEGMKSAWSLRFTPIDLEHGTSESKKSSLSIPNPYDPGVIGTVLYSTVVFPDNYGSTIASDYVDVYAELRAQIDANSIDINIPVDEGEQPFLFGIGAVYKNKFPEQTKDIIRSFVDGSLRYSMEMRYHKIACSVCAAEFSFGDRLCEHITDDRTIIESKPERGVKILRDTFYTAASIVGRPADLAAKGLAIGSDDDNGGINDMADNKTVYMSFETEGEMNEFLAEKIAKETTPLRQENEKLADQLDNKDKEIKVQEDKLKDLENAEPQTDEETANKIADLEKARDEYKEKFEAVENELTTLKKSIENEKVLASRMETLSSLKVDVPEDAESEDYKDFVNQVLSFDETGWNFYVKSLESAASKAATKEQVEEVKEEGKDSDENLVEASQKNAPPGTTDVDVTDSAISEGTSSDNDDIGKRITDVLSV